MRINVKATRIELTPAISDYVEKKVGILEKLVDKGDTVAICDVEVGKPSKHHHSGDVFYAEFNLQTSHGLFRAANEEGTLYAAIDKTKDDVQRELRREKRKQVHMQRKGGSRLKEITQTLATRGTQLKDFVIRNKKRKR